MRTRLLATVMALAVLAGLSLATAPAASAQPYCGITWGSQPRAGGSGAPVGGFGGVRTGHHECFDRLVVNVTAPVRSWSVRYVDGLGPWAPGGAQLEVAAGTTVAVSHTWLFHYELAQVPSYTTFRSVVAGNALPRSTSVWLGVRARLPFRAFVLQGPGGGSRLVVDVAHQWCATGTTC